MYHSSRAPHAQKRLETQILQLQEQNALLKKASATSDESRVRLKHFPSYAVRVTDFDPVDNSPPPARATPPSAERRSIADSATTTQVYSTGGSPVTSPEMPLRRSPQRPQYGVKKLQVYTATATEGAIPRRPVTAGAAPTTGSAPVDSKLKAIRAVVDTGRVRSAAAATAVSSPPLGEGKSAKSSPPKFGHRSSLGSTGSDPGSPPHSEPIVKRPSALQSAPPLWRH